MPTQVVLVVEDDPVIRLDLASMIEDAGIVVVEAANADEAILALESRRDISVVFTDIEMPGSMDGLKLAFAVRDRWPPVTIIISSGRVSPASDEMPANATFLPKPHSEERVIATLRAVA
ncbi:hypothetical protein ASE61_25760 [Bosea sp. Root670]|uniref:response regulator n=1 Tax=Bosea sp. Root670 TaxID=1736583 RepID=UPI0007123464|nr:response regulator [Bosea sp. Root670]KRE04265.1 hypothetical protein ASE61_25760 [Bosea sp. Root670]